MDAIRDEKAYKESLMFVAGILKYENETPVESRVQQAMKKKPQLKVGCGIAWTVYPVIPSN